VCSSDYQRCLVTGKNILKFDCPPFVVFNNDKTGAAVVKEDKRELLSFLIEEGKKGLGVQRYKGLGEMNPDQLWETTMDPNKRTLLQIKIEDVVEADEIFTILMGEEVEPRREFIQNNALNVSVLDI
jgi:DNA gyrase subunit B